MGTENINELISNHLLGRGSEEDERELLDWINSDPAHRKFYEQFLQRTEFVKQYRQYVGIDKEYPLRKFRRTHPGAHRNISYLKPLRYAAAILILMVTGAVVWWYKDYTRVTPPEMTSAVRTAIEESRQNGDDAVKVDTPSGLSTPSSATSSQLFADAIAEIKERFDRNDLTQVTTLSGKEYWVSLDDGTLVHLNNNSYLIYPKEFGRSSRDVILEGEAYFMVAKDKSRKFIVHTPEGDVTVHGTEFDVKTSSLSGASSTEVVLVEGSVAVNMNGKEAMMRPGQKAVLTLHGNTPAITEVDIAPYVAWNTNKFNFQNWTLDRIMTVFSKWYGMDVRFMDDSHRAQRFSGSFNRYDDMDDALEVLESGTGFKIIRDNNCIIIY